MGDMVDSWDVSMIDKAHAGKGKGASHPCYRLMEVKMNTKKVLFPLVGDCAVLEHEAPADPDACSGNSGKIRIAGAVISCY